MVEDLPALLLEPVGYEHLSPQSLLEILLALL